MSNLIFYTIKGDPEKYGYISKDCWTIKFERIDGCGAFHAGQWVLRDHRKVEVARRRLRFFFQEEFFIKFSRCDG